MDLTIFLATFGLVFVAELGDKTQITAMALATRYPWKKIFVGIALAFALLDAGAVVVGSVLFKLVPPLWIGLASGGLFLFFGVATLRAGDEDDETASASNPTHGPTVTAFLMILVAELGDKTQLVTASLAAQHAAPFTVFAASTLALWLVSLLGIFVGSQLTRFVPLKYVHKAAGVLFLVFGVAFLYEALRPG